MPGTDKYRVLSAEILCVLYHENPRQTLGEVSTSVGSTAVDIRPTMVRGREEGWEGLKVNSNLITSRAPTWPNFLNLIVIGPMQRPRSTHELGVVKQLQLWSGAPFAVPHPCAFPFFFAFS